MSTPSYVIDGNDRFEYREYNSLLNKLIYDNEKNGYNLRSVGHSLSMSANDIKKLDYWGSRKKDEKEMLSAMKRQHGDNVLYDITSTKGKKKDASLPDSVCGKYITEAALDDFACSISVDYLVKHNKRKREMAEATIAVDDDDNVSVVSSVSAFEDSYKVQDSLDKIMRRLCRMEHKQDASMHYRPGNKRAPRNDNRRNDGEEEQKEERPRKENRRKDRKFNDRRRPQERKHESSEEE